MIIIKRPFSEEEPANGAEVSRPKRKGSLKLLIKNKLYRKALVLC